VTNLSKSLSIYTDGFQAYAPLESDDAFNREYLVHNDREYADDEVHVNTCESPRIAGATMALAASRYL